MKTAAIDTSIECYHDHVEGKTQGAQCARILKFIEEQGGSWSIGEIANALHMEKSTVSARVNYMLNTTKELEAKLKRKDRVSGITIRPVGLPAKQGDFFDEFL